MVRRQRDAPLKRRHNSHLGNAEMRDFPTTRADNNLSKDLMKVDGDRCSKIKRAM
jgi:hypothetical protein